MGVDVLGHFVGQPAQFLEVRQCRSLHCVHASELLGQPLLAGRSQASDSIKR